MTQALRPLLLAPALLLSACAATPSTVRVVKPLDRPVAARAVAVYPFAFRWNEPPSRSLLLGMVAADALAETGRLLVLGPGEFTVLRQDVEDPRLATNLLSLLGPRGLTPAGLVALRAWAEQRVERTTGSIEGKGVVRNSERITYVEHLELLDGNGGGVLLELSGEVVRPPGAAEEPFDPTPELTRLHRQLVARAVDALAGRLTGARLPEVSVTARWLPAAALDWAPPGQRSLAARLADADPLDADVQRLAVYRFAAPEATDAQLARWRRLPGGLLVESASGPWGEALRPGDVVVAANGEPALGRHVLARVAALSRSGVVELKVARGGATLPITVMLR